MTFRLKLNSIVRALATHKESIIIVQNKQLMFFSFFVESCKAAESEQTQCKGSSRIDIFTVIMGKWNSKVSHDFHVYIFHLLIDVGNSP